ncbi:arsenic resistance protein [Salirhabdus salicampi]|uniref:arsenic resistance protein n=1 Tax=Salirhabdus salicampi TaxID=476102 RepID=UPI0020C54690|nr:bile acid:sodium symporter [Salirhabdus salicampi]MCP8615851.1 arsenic resistance protein [Salirhabdus salicampi]
MNIFDKYYILFVFVSIVLGFGLGQINTVPDLAEAVIVPLLIGMLYFTFLEIPIRKVVSSYKHIRFTSASLIINFLWSPFVAWILAQCFLTQHFALYVGFLLLIVTPCTDWYLIFTKASNGNVHLSTAILPLNFLVQIVLLPVFLYVFVGITGILHLVDVIKSIFLMFIFPMFGAFLTKQIGKTKTVQRLQLSISNIPTVLLLLAITAMFTSQGGMFIQHIRSIWWICIPLALFFFINYVVSFIVAKKLQFPKRDRISLHFTTLARNSPLALAFAMTTFPNEPLIALLLATVPLLELPFLAALSGLLK